LNPFRVQCSKCRGKIAIRSDKLLGQSIACPRCQQPIQIPTLDAIDPSQRLPVDSQALTNADLEGVVASTVSPPIQTSGAITRDFDDVDALLAAGSEQNRFSNEELQTSAVESPINDSNLQVDELATPGPSHTWQNPTAQKRQIKMLIAFASIIFLLSATILVLFLSSRDANEPIVAQNNDANPTDSEVEVPNDNQPKADNPSVPTVVPEAVVAPNANPTPNAIDTTNPNPTIDNTVPVDPTNQPLVTPPAALELPAEIDPIKSILNNAEASAIPTTEATDDNISDEMPDWMKQFAPILGDDVAMPDTTSIDPNEVDGGNATAEVIDIETLYHPAPSKLPVWDEVRSTPIIKLSIPELPLLEIVTTLESMYGVPIDWDLSTLSNVTFDTAKTYSGSFENTTLEKVYDEVLAAFEYTYTVSADGFVTAVPKVLPDVITSIDIATLEPSSAKPEAWLTFFQRMFPEFASELSINANAIQLSDAVPVESKLEVARLVMILQDTSIGLTDQQPVSMQRDPLIEIFSRMQRSGTKTFAEKRSVTSILYRSARDVDLTLLIDWDQCWAHGLTPQDATAAITSNRNLSQIFRFGTDKFALTTIVDPQGRLVLTTPDVQRKTIRFSVIELPAGTDLGQFRTLMLSLSPTDAQGKSTLRIIPLPSTDPTTRYVVRTCAPSMAQMFDDRFQSALNLPVTN
jgi:hypothetical protein